MGNAESKIKQVRPDVALAGSSAATKRVTDIFTDPENKAAFQAFLKSKEGENAAMLQNFEALRALDKAAVEASAKEIRSTFEEGDTLAAAMHSAQSSSVVALAVALYPQFLEYLDQDAKAGEARECAATDKEPSFQAYMSHMSVAEEQALSRSVVERAIGSVDNQAVDLLGQGSWLASLLVAVETLPVCVSIATASRDRPGFPLIYVNHYFETTSGYLRDEIVGRNCRFLQSGRGEAEAIKQLSEALRDAKPIKVSITNYRKDGTPFRNLLSMKPIFSEEGEYMFVVGVQFDVTQADATPAKLKLAEELIKMLPDVIPSEGGEGGYGVQGMQGVQGAQGGQGEGRGGGQEGVQRVHGAGSPAKWGQGTQKMNGADGAGSSVTKGGKGTQNLVSGGTQKLYPRNVL
ncbi:hypothetical protein B484DRAFT_358721 [Ochromonadaceae sp. CCMP2298]|nr:hypothetical protein B484DRAFT_358721 [Ochromonadaceae sp. CCMP2298]